MVARVCLRQRKHGPCGDHMHMVAESTPFVPQSWGKKERSGGTPPSPRQESSPAPLLRDTLRFPAEFRCAAMVAESAPFVPQSWGKRKREVGDTPKPPAGAFSSTSSEGCPQIPGSALLHRTTHRGVQRGVAPLRFTSIPQDWGIQGVEEGLKTTYHRETWSSARPKAFSTLCFTPSESVSVPE